MIPFFKTSLGIEEIFAITECINSGWVVMGKKTEEFEQKFAEYVGAKYCVMTDSGTSALFLALQYQIKYKFERNRPFAITVPSLTFVSTAEIIANSYEKIRFGDVSLKDFCLKEVGKYSLPVHLTGNKAKDGAYIYDSAHRIERGDVKNSPALWCYSFYATKNMSTVQGGAICLNDKDRYEWLKKARDHGMTKGTKERYESKSPLYDIEFVGYRVKPDDLRAVIGLEQLKKLPEMTAKRNEAVARYNSNLGLNRTGNHLYPILVNDRESFFQMMIDAEIQCSVHFLPLHKMTAYKKYYKGEDMTNTNYLGERLVSLPLFPQMTDEEIDYISEKVLETKLLII